ncbi:hybrid sensor histidine kinase/response regulator [Microcoleus sp. FACHB-672]|uniref:hybrid sensor histidine kinase/response regulator n=1 Tax=Microcoleus sp. FACHB-672 TaxID=2692825 RepID=UPI001F54D5ED|nr:hybrid sensor histidine kinase/response regulator [Microcoleus sp. FACHB-672]
MKYEDLSNFSMMDLFRMEVENQAALLNNSLLALETNPNIAAELESLMRAAHSIKGAARIVQVEGAVKIAHVMEDCFVAAQKGTIRVDSAGTIDVLLHGVDELIRLAQLSESDIHSWQIEHQAEIDTLIAAIAAIASPAPEAHPLPPVLIQAEIEPPSENLAIQPADNLSQSDAPALLVPAAIDSTEQTFSIQPLSPSKEDAQFSAQNSKFKFQNNTERVVRLSAENLNRLMGLAGESLVEVNWLQPFADSLFKLRKQQGELSNLLEKLQESFEGEQLKAGTTETLNFAQQKASECNQTLNERLSELELFSRRFGNLSDRLYREVIASHMRPFADGVQGFPRMVRDLARHLGKQVKFEIVGKSTQVDRDILEKLEAPLTHILQNAIAHGIEFPEERLAAGKPADGTVRLEATHRAGMLSITISDDGQGVNFNRLREKIVEKNLSTSDIVAQLTETELIDFLFLPGFSTRNTVSQISGRGVGLDVAQSVVREFGGVLRAVSKQGKGMSFHLQLPLTLSVIRTLLVEISGEPYAFPLTRIERIVLVPKETIPLVENRQYFMTDNQTIGLVAAYQVLELNPFTLNSEDLPVVIISDRSSRYGLVVDRFLGERDLVVRPLDPRLGKVQDISAAAILEDGSPVLIIDVEDMVRSIDKLLANGRLNPVSSAGDSAPSAPRKRILVVDDSITVREVERKLLENNGYEVEVAVNGVDGWNAVRTGQYNLIITDVDMPRMNGIELVTQIKNHSNFKSLPVMIVSYKDREEDRLRGLEAGANYYLTKSSFHDDTLLNAVIDLIGE